MNSHSNNARMVESFQSLQFPKEGKCTPCSLGALGMGKWQVQAGPSSALELLSGLGERCANQLPGSWLLEGLSRVPRE